MGNIRIKTTHTLGHTNELVDWAVAREEVVAARRFFVVRITNETDILRKSVLVTL